MNLLTTEDVAALLKIKPQTLRKMRTHGGGPLFEKIGALVRYDPRAVDNWRAQRVCKNTGDADRLAST